MTTIPPPGAEPPATREGRVLLVDDDRELCQMLTEYLEAEHFEVTSVHDGADALAALSENSPWLLSRICGRRTLSDVSMSNLRIYAFPGIEWSQSLLEAVQYAANRLWPNKELLALRKQLAQTEVTRSDSQWHHSSQARRLLRWVVARPPRAETMHTVRAALERAR